MFQRSRLFLSAAVLSTALSAQAVEFQPWQAFSNDTVAVVNVPMDAAYVDAIGQTKMAQLINVDEVFAGFMSTMEEADPEAYAEFRSKLESVGLEVQDFTKLFSGAMGGGVQVWGSADDDSLDFQVIAWLSPGGEVLDQFMDALTRALSQQTEPEERQVQRIDHELNGVTVMELRGPRITSKTVITDEGMTTVEDVPVEGDEPNFNLLRDGDRVYISIQRDRDDGEAYRLRLLAFQQACQAQTVGTFGESVLASSFFNQHQASGVLGYEFFADVEKILSFIPMEENEFGPSARDIMAATGVADIGKISLRSVLRGGLSLATVLLETKSAPRGVLGIFDQTPVSPVFPDWIPAVVNDAQVLSLDLSKVYASMKEMAFEIAGPEAEQGFQQANGGVAMYLGMDLPTLFAALGDTHYFITYPISNEEIRDSVPALDLDGGPMAEDPFEQQIRVAWVQDVRDAEAATKFVNGLSNALSMWGLVTEASEEQGFTGWRIDEDAFYVGVFLGQGRLVISFDEQSLSQTLNYLTTPPPAESRLNTQAIVPLLAAQLPATPSISYAYQNLGSVMREAVATMNTMFDMAEMHADDEIQAKVFTWIRSVMPEADEMQNAFGKAMSHFFVSEKGMGMNVLAELPLIE